jgi:hypothetical protein
MKHSLIRAAAFLILLSVLGFLPAQADSADAVTGATPEEQGADAVTGASLDASGGGKAPSVPRPTLFGLRQPLSAHAVTGFTSAGLLAVSGLLGGIRFLDMEARAHEQRDALGIHDEDEIGAACTAIIRDAWGAGQELRWWHAGVLALGECLYLYDAITGFSMLNSMGPGYVPAKIHRWAFFAHLGLMAGDIALGFLLTDALSRGDHEAVTALGAAHAGIGIAIPLVVIGSGIAIESARPKRAIKP